MTRLAVIGSAGRGTDAERIDAALYDAAYDETLRAIADFGAEELVSGGAAFADHLAVRAFLEGACSRLTLFLPAAWDGERRGYRRGSGRGDPGTTANRYHEGFSKSVGIDSLSELQRAMGMSGCVTEVYHGFKRRNLEVADRATHVLALTFGGRTPDGDHGPDDRGFGDHEAAGLKDGGTAHTWTQSYKADVKRHVDLYGLARRATARPTA